LLRFSVWVFWCYHDYLSSLFKNKPIIQSSCDITIFHTTISYILQDVLCWLENNKYYNNIGSLIVLCLSLEWTEVWRYKHIQHSTKIWIYRSESNSWIYFYILLNKNWKIYWFEQSFTGLGVEYRCSLWWLSAILVINTIEFQSVVMNCSFDMPIHLYTQHTCKQKLFELFSPSLKKTTGYLSLVF
jgi:hypothetical protein